MYKQKRFNSGPNKRRASSAQNKGYSKYSSGNSGSNRYNKSGGGSRGSYAQNGKRPFKSHWRKKNRRRNFQTIAHSMYISKAKNVNAEPPYVHQNGFSDLNLHTTLASNIAGRGYEKPTKIQDQAIPQILKGKDVLGIGSTGSGKTGAFLIPMIDKILKNPKGKVLIVSPTRELASQICGEFKRFSVGTKLKIVLVMGGASIRDQIRLLRASPQFVVATPGRLIDLERRKCINLSEFNNVVLDEVDQMLDMGFVDDIKLLIAKLAPQRQSLFFSATMSGKEEVLANTLLNDPIKVESDKQSPLKSIHQDIVKFHSKTHKMQVLHELLIKKELSKVLVFSRTRAGADNISYDMRQKGIMIDSLHGDKSQYKRSKVLAKFRQDKIDVLVATDVAARGIDVADITHVINFDEPATYNDYIHRIGRTGRAGKTGTALTFVLHKTSTHQSARSAYAPQAAQHSHAPRKSSRPRNKYKR